VSTKCPYVVTDEADMSCRLTYVPSREEIPVIGDVATVVEFYSR